MLKLTRAQRAAFYQDCYRAFDNIREGFRQWGWLMEDGKTVKPVPLLKLYIGRSRN